MMVNEYAYLTQWSMWLFHLLWILLAANVCLLLFLKDAIMESQLINDIVLFCDKMDALNSMDVPDIGI